MSPSNVPHTERDKNIMAGFILMAFPMIRGVSIKSCMACTIIYMAMASQNNVQKLASLLTEHTRHISVVGMSDTSCR